MKLLFENWRKFIKEDIGYFGNKFVQFKQEVDKGTHPLLAAQLHLEYIGKGSTRKVFGFQDNKSHLLKVINVDLDAGKEVYDADWRNPFTGFSRKHKTVSNENEADLIMQQRYPQIFPRTYEVADDYSWILAERVQPLGDEELATELGIPAELTKYENRSTYFVLLDMAMNQIKEGMVNEVEDTIRIDTLETDDEAKERRLKSREEYERKELSGFTFAELEEVAANMIKDSHIRKLLRAVIDLQIPPRELVAKNMGISKFGGDHLVILDASLWEYADEAEGEYTSKAKSDAQVRQETPPASDTFAFRR